MSDGFLSRWSRRKRDEARRPAEVAPDPGLPDAPAAETTGDEVGLSPEELAQLPSLDALTAATDLTPFLRAGVPRVLRNAALRRMWSIDPAIRDFVSEAREYAYDWNTPGGVPGTGGAISAEDVRAMVEKVFGGGEQKPAALADESHDTGDDALPLSPRGRDEGRDDLVVGAASREPQVRRECEGESPEEPHPEIPPQRPVDPFGIDAQPRPVDGKEGDLRSPGALVRPAARGDVSDPRDLSPADQGTPHRSLDRPDPEPPTPPRLRRHGGALPI